MEERDTGTETPYRRKSVFSWTVDPFGSMDSVPGVFFVVHFCPTLLRLLRRPGETNVKSFLPTKKSFRFSGYPEQNKGKKEFTERELSSFTYEQGPTLFLDSHKNFNLGENCWVRNHLKLP